MAPQETAAETHLTELAETLEVVVDTMKSVDTILFKGVDRDQVVRDASEMTKNDVGVCGIRYFDAGRQKINPNKKHKFTRQLFALTIPIDPQFTVEVLQVEGAYKPKKLVVSAARQWRGS